MQSSVSKWLVEVLHTSSKTITSLGVIFAFLFLAGGWVWDRLLADSIIESVQELNGTPQIVAAIEDVTMEQRAIRTEVGNLSAQVTAITPDPQVVEYDALRTRAPEPCFRGEECRVNIRSKRTSFGETCGTPSVVSRTFTDAQGLSFNPYRATPSRPVQQGGSWSTTTVDFIVPREASLGVGEYILTLRYENCSMQQPGTGKVIRFNQIELDTFPALVTIQPRQE